MSDLDPTRRPSQSGASIARRIVLDLLRRGDRRAPGDRPAGTLVVEDPVRSAVEVFGSGEPTVTVTIHDERTYRSVLTGGSVGMAEARVAGWWDADDLPALVRIALRRTSSVRQRLDRWGGHRLWELPAMLRPPSREKDRRHVAAHYDLSNELFSLMLDPTMAYSCAWFEHPRVELEEAQRAKFDRLATRLRLRPADRVVEIGTGWGGFAIHLAERFGCQVVTTTISEAQRELAAKRVAERGLTDRVEVLGLDYRDLEGRFDALVSVEMIEAVDWRRHDEFFTTCHRLLEPHGRMGLQAITINETSYRRARHHRDFIRKLVFPGGCLPSVSAIAGSVARTGDLRIVGLEDIGSHYPETLRRWRANVNRNREEIERLGFDERFLRFWDLYLSYCEAAFEERHISDVQVVLARPGARA